MTRTAWRIYQEAKRLDADIYHFHDPELIPVGLLLRARGKKVIYDIHEDVPRDVLDKHYLPNWSRNILSWIIEKFENSASRRFSALVGVTPLITDRFKPLNPRTVMVQNFPIPEELATVAPIPWNDRGMAVTYVGGIAVLRGIREMVQAMGLLPESLESTLELAGTAIYGDSLEVVSKQSGWSRTRYLGYLNRVGIANLFSRVRAGLVLFHPAPNHVAAMPMKLFEYMAAGLPVIASNFPTWREIVGGARCGLLVDPLKPREIANAIEHILTNPQEAEEMGRRGQEAVRKTYNWASQEKILLDLYCKLLKPPCAA